MSKLFLDIETIPGQGASIIEALRADARAEKDACKAPGNYKDPEKIAANIAEQHAAIDVAFEDRWRKTSFDGAFGQIAVVSFALNDGEPVKIYRDDYGNPEAEKHVLMALCDALNEVIKPNMELATQVIGHNVLSFDLRFIVQRSIVCGVRPHPVLARAASAKPWDTDKVFDTMAQWNPERDKRISLDKLCKALGMPGKGEIDGSKVWDYVQAGRIAEVADYCADDVNKVRAAYKRMTFTA